MGVNTTPGYNPYKIYYQGFITYTAILQSFLNSSVFSKLNQSCVISFLYEIFQCSHKGSNQTIVPDVFTDIGSASIGIVRVSQELFYEGGLIAFPIINPKLKIIINLISSKVIKESEVAEKS